MIINGTGWDQGPNYADVKSQFEEADEIWRREARIDKKIGKISILNGIIPLSES